MIDLATFGVSINPAGAIAGAAAVAAAAAGVVASLRGVQAAMRTVGEGRGGFAAIGAAAQASARTIYTAFNRATLGVAGLFGVMAKNIISDIKAIGGAISSMGRGFATFGLAIQGLQTAFAPLTAAARQAMDFVKGSMDVAADMESTELAIRNLLSSSEKAKVMMGELQTLAKNTTLSFPETADAARQLLSYGIAADKVLPALKRLADLNALTGGKSSVKDLAYLYGTAATQSQLYKRDLNQFANRGIDVISAMSLEMKKSKAELMDMITKGKVGFKDLERTIVAMTEKGGIAFGAQSAQMESWNGRVAKLEESWTLLKQAVGDPIIDGLKPLLDDLTGIVDSLTVQIKEMYPAIREVVEYIPAAFRVMRQEGGLKLAFEAATDFLSGRLKQIWGFAKDFLGATFEWIAANFTAAMKVLASPEFWSGVGTALVNGVKAASAAILESIIDPFSARIKGMANEGYREALGSQMQSETVERQAIIDRSNAGIPLPGDAARAAEISENTARTVQILDDLKSSSETDPSLFPGMGPGIPFEFDAGESWAQNAPTPTDTELEFNGRVEGQKALEEFTGGMKLLWQALNGGSASQEAAAEARRNEMDALNAASGEQPDRAAARRAASAARASQREDELMGRTADRLMAEADPEEKYNQRIALIQKLADAGKITVEKQRVLEAEAAQQYELDMQKKVKSTEKAGVAMLTPLQRLAAEWGNIQKRSQEASASIAQAFASNVTSGLMDMITGAKSVGEAFSAMAQGIIKDIANIIVKLLVEYAISKAIAGFRGGVGGGGGGMFGLGLFGILHEGGEAGAPPATRTASAGLLSSARRYHSGGVAGLNPGEVPAILERGEHVMTRKGASEQKRKMMGAAAPGKAEKPKPGMIINTIDPRQIMTLIAENPDAVLNILNFKKAEIKRMLA
jgi:hypothetical protein